MGIAGGTRLAVHRSNVDDYAAPLGYHLLRCSLRAQESTLEIHGQHKIPLSFVNIDNEAAGIEPGIVDQDVQSSECLDRLLSQSCRFAAICNVRNQIDSLTIPGFDLLSRPAGRLGIKIADYHLRPFARQPKSDCPANTLACPCDHYYPVDQLHRPVSIGKNSKGWINFLKVGDLHLLEIFPRLFIVELIDDLRFSFAFQYDVPFPAMLVINTIREEHVMMPGDIISNQCLTPLQDGFAGCIAESLGSQASLVKDVIAIQQLEQLLADFRKSIIGIDREGLVGGAIFQYQSILITLSVEDTVWKKDMKMPFFPVGKPAPGFFADLINGDFLHGCDPLVKSRTDDGHLLKGTTASILTSPGRV